MTWKQKAIRHDTTNGRVRLSKGANHKEHPRAWEYILVEYETRPGVTVENLQQVRAVSDKAKGRWELHLVCKHEVETPDAPGNKTAGIDLGICNFAAVAYSTEEADLYPGNRLKQDGYYFPKEIVKCDDSGGQEATRLHAKWSERRTHFFHSLAKHIVQRCIENGVGHINVGKLAGVREDDNGNGNSKNWGKHGNLDLHGWAFDPTGSRTSSNTKPNSKPSKSSKCRSATRAKRVVSAVGKTTVSVSNVACTCARNTTMRSTPM